MEKTNAIKLVEGFFKPDAAILADGEYPSSVALEALEKAPFVVCCDGAAVKWISEGRMPDAIVGDGDSLPQEIKEKYESVFHWDPDQETNDQTKAVRFLKSEGKKNILIFGATGKREDHTLGNISLLIKYMEEGQDVRSVTDFGVFVPCSGNCKFRSFEGQQVSIFNFGAKDLAAEGLKYRIYDFSSWWQGTLNESLGREFTIKATGNYIVFLVFEPKK